MIDSYIGEFHAAFGVPIRETPTIPKEDECALRVSLLQEELNELVIALGHLDIVETLDALCDLQVVLDGTFLQFGMGSIKEEAIAEVHRSNMTKLGTDGEPIYRKDGKVIKGPDFERPKLLPILERANENTTPCSTR